MKRIIIVMIAMLCVLPVFAREFGKAEAQSCGLFDAVNDNYSLFGGLDDSHVEYGFEMESAASAAHPAKWMAEGAMLVYGVIYVKLPAGVSASEMVVTKETGGTFTKVNSYMLNEGILMIVPSDEHDVLTIIRPGSKWAGLKLAHIHTHEEEDAEEDDLLSGIKWEVAE